MAIYIRRREFILTLGGAAAAWPLAARAQQPERMRHIGVLMPFFADDVESQTRMGAFLQTLALSGWTIGRNVRIDTRWGARDADRIHRHALELAALAPDVILAHGISTVGPLRQATRTVPIVFPVMNDPVGLGVVDSLARPGGNITGFISWEFNFSGKWLELLKQAAPDVTRVAVIRDTATSRIWSNSRFRLDFDTFHRQRRIPVRRGRSRHDVEQPSYSILLP
jgi:putative tryptophan/tyrosine transport system substrate-binding protein